MAEERTYKPSEMAAAILALPGSAEYTVKPITITQNGVYEESGIAYSPIIVEVESGTGGSLILRVKAPEGSTVTASKDDQTYTAEEESGVWDISIPEYGVYTVKVNNDIVTANIIPYEIDFSKHVFGVCWDYSNPSTALTRLTKSNDPQGYVDSNITTDPIPTTGNQNIGSSPFDAFMPWKGMEQYNILYDGTIIKCGEDGFSQTENDTMVWIPEFYYAVIDNSSAKKRYLYISNELRPGFEKHPGSGRYIGRYNSITGNYSKSGAKLIEDIKMSDARDGARDKGSEWSNYDFAAWCAVGLLYLIEYADWNSQEKIGQGIVNDSATHNTGETDSMIYHTGRVSGTDGKTAVQYRWIENLWGNVYDYVDGINFYNRSVYICTNPDNYADDTTTNYIAAGVTLPSTNNWTKELGISKNFPWAYLPNAIGGSATTYISDYVYSNTGWRALCSGGSFELASSAGLFFFYGSYVSSWTSSHYGARLQYIPKEV